MGGNRRSSSASSAAVPVNQPAGSATRVVCVDRLKKEVAAMQRFELVSKDDVNALVLLKKNGILKDRKARVSRSLKGVAKDVLASCAFQADINYNGPKTNQNNTNNRG